MFCKNLCLRIIHCRPKKSQQQNGRMPWAANILAIWSGPQRRFQSKHGKKQKTQLKVSLFLPCVVFFGVQLSELLLQFNFQKANHQQCNKFLFDLKRFRGQKSSHETLYLYVIRLFHCLHWALCRLNLENAGVSPQVCASRWLRCTPAAPPR